MRRECACGRRKSKYALRCNKCHEIAMEGIHAKARAVVDTGVCPKCGRELIKNNALHGWWQCAGYGVQNGEALGTGSRCLFQCFTER